MADTHVRRRLFRRSLVVVGVLVVLFAGAAWYRHAVETAAEDEALEFVRINGYTGGGYRHNRVSRLLTVIPRGPNQYPLGAQRLTTVAFPRDRMTNNMAQYLMKTRRLEFITLYPADPDGSGIDHGVNSVSIVQSLRDLELPLSEKSISSIEQRFPNLVIRVAERRRDEAATQTESDAVR